MFCSNCGYENPAGHRFCGMCGTPFPHRSLTVPSAQSTLSFTSAPLEIIAPAKFVAAVAEPIESPARPITATPLPSADNGQPPARLEIPEPEVIPEEQSSATSTAAEETPAHWVEDIPTEQAPVEVEQATKEEPTSAVFPRLTEAAVGSGEADIFPESVAGLEQPRVTEAGPFAQSKERSTPVHQPDSPPPPVPEPEPQAKPPQYEPKRPIAPLSQFESEPPIEPKPGFEPPTSITVQQDRERVDLPKVPVVLRPVTVRTPPAHGGTISERASTSQTVTASTSFHRSPDSIPITPPPASAGMPTFQEVADAAGAPPLSPFEQLAQTPTTEDDELKQFVANFRYTPPEETADELTMRSEVPVVDKEAPAEFHHPSFDGDEPPPAAEPHPTGQEYYPPPGEVPRSRFLEIDEAAHQAKKPSTGKPGSLLGLDTQPTIPTSEISPPARQRNWLWISILVLIAVFGTLGFFEGRAQKDVFRGPIEWVLMEYGILRNQVMEKLTAKAPENAKTPETTPQETPQQNSPETKPQPPAEQPGTPPAESTAPSSTLAQSDTTNNAGSTSEPPTPRPQTAPPTGAQASSPNVAANVTPARPIEPPPTAQPSNKAQPGQQELSKALNASDATAAAAWLWKATSRGNPEAPVRLADMYIRGNGVPRSCEQALVLLRSAAMKENAPARNRLAALYANGTCVGRDKVRAYQLMSSALQADPNSEWARENRQALWNQMTPSERAMAQKNR